MRKEEKIFALQLQLQIARRTVELLEGHIRELAVEEENEAIATRNPLAKVVEDMREATITSLETSGMKFTSFRDSDRGADDTD